MVYLAKTKLAKQGRERDQRIKGLFKNLETVGKNRNIIKKKVNKVSEGFVKNWKEVLSDLMEEKDSTFHQLIQRETKVKPYFIVTTNSGSREKATRVIIEACIKLMLKQWDISLKEDAFKIQYTNYEQDNIQITICLATGGSTGTTWCFETQKHAEWFGQLVEKEIQDTCLCVFVVDQYKANKQIDFVGKFSGGLTTTDDDNADPVDFIVSYIPEPSKLLRTPELTSVVKDIDIRKEQMSPYSLEYILGVIHKSHPSLNKESLHFDSGFYTINYSNREEKCVSSGTCHQEAGVCFFIQDKIIKMACMHAQCVDTADRKLVVPICLDFEMRITFLDMRPQISLLSSGVGQIAKELFKGTAKYALNKFHILENGIWIPDQDKLQMRQRVISELSELYNQFKKAHLPPDHYEQACTLTDEEWKGFKKQHSKILDLVCIPKVLMQLQITDPVFGGRLDNHPEYLAAKNGMVCLRTKSLDPFTAGSMVTRCLNTEYHPDAVCEKWVTAVRDMMGNNQKEYDYLRWMIGYALQGKPIQKLLFVLYGKHGGNGKTLLMNTIREVLGVYAGPLDIDVFKSKTSGKSSPHLVALKNRRVGCITDADKDMIIQGGATKQLTSGRDCFSARANYGDQIEVSLTVVPFICTNHILGMDLKGDPALSDQLVVVPFENKYIEGEPREPYERSCDKGLADVFSTPEARVGILAWLVDCGEYYHQNPEKEPTEKMKQYKQSYIEEQEEE